MHILVVGAGSIGQRHIKNLVELGVGSVAVVDTDVDRLLSLSKIGDVAGFTCIEDALRLPTDAAIVSVPTHLHMEVALQLAQHNMPLFIEKPVANILEDAWALRDLQDHFKQWTVIGYSMRFHPAIQIVKELLPEIGTPLYARAEVGQYLPDWHPDEDYRNWYMAHEDQGGGALLDLSHEIDYMRWLFGGIDGHNEGYVDKISELDIDSDDIAEFNIAFCAGPYASIHMDLLDRSYNRRLRIVGSEGTIDWGNKGNYVSLFKPIEGFTYHQYDQERNVQFMEEMKAFVDSVECGIPHPEMATLEDGIEVLKVVKLLKEQNGR